MTLKIIILNFLEVKDKHSEYDTVNYFITFFHMAKVIGYTCYLEQICFISSLNVVLFIVLFQWCVLVSFVFL